MTWSLPRRWFPSARLGVLVLAATAASLPVARPTVADLPPHRSSGHAIRKERPSPGAASDEADDAPAVDSRPVETWATLINVHTGEAVPLSGAEPTQARFSDVLSDRVTGSRIEL